MQIIRKLTCKMTAALRTQYRMVTTGRADMVATLFTEEQWTVRDSVLDVIVDVGNFTPGCRTENK